MSSNILNIFTYGNNRPNISPILVYVHYYLPAWLWLPTPVSSALLTQAWVSQPLQDSPDRLGKDDIPWICPLHLALIPDTRPWCPTLHGGSAQLWTFTSGHPSLVHSGSDSHHSAPADPVIQPMQMAAWWCSHLTIIGLTFSGRGKGNWRKSFSFIK